MVAARYRHCIGTYSRYKPIQDSRRVQTSSLDPHRLTVSHCSFLYATVTLYYTLDRTVGLRIHTTVEENPHHIETKTFRPSAALRQFRSCPNRTDPIWGNGRDNPSAREGEGKGQRNKSLMMNLIPISPYYIKHRSVVA